MPPHGGDSRPSLDANSARLRASRYFVLVMLACLSLTGCASSQWIKERHRPKTPLAQELQFFSWRGPAVSARTRQLLRRWDLAEEVRKDAGHAVEILLAMPPEQWSVDHLHAVAELALVAARIEEGQGHTDRALDLYGISVAHAYAYLFDDLWADARNPYDPRFRQSSDIYNSALESALRIVQRRGQLLPGTELRFSTTTHDYSVQIVCRGNWHPDAIKELRFVADFEVTGLKNHYETFGLGVPLIGVQNCESKLDVASKYYAPGMGFPVTALLRVAAPMQTSTSGRRQHVCVLELHDPLVASDIVINDRLVPLQTDLTTPLAYSLDDRSFRRANGVVTGFLNLESSRKNQGLYLLEPYDPNKIPVVMIHGLWSNLVTWMEMFNDLRGLPEIRDRYQFWFYLYPTGQPFLLTAADLRRELDEARRTLDPQSVTGALDQMVLVGHSMGGLIARLQTLESGDRYVRLLEQGDAPVEAESLSPEVRDTIFFEPALAVSRVVTIASPHQGSALANGAAQWLSRRVIRVPEVILATPMPGQDRFASSRQRDGAWQIQTSIEALSPASPLLECMQASPSAEWVRYHNIVGSVQKDHVLARVARDSDGVVTLASAHLEGAVSELVVDADHVNIHRHPRTILEVQRILLEHVASLPTELTDEEQTQELMEN